MKAVFDANFFIRKELPRIDISKGFIPNSVIKELKDEVAREYFEFHNFNIEPRDPQEKYISEVNEAIKNKNVGLSIQDVHVVALMLELAEESCNWIGPENIKNIEGIVCLTKDNGIKNALAYLGLLEDENFKVKTFKLRCYCCYKIYDKHVDFCKSCGYNTITRVAVSEKDNGKEFVYLKKNYKVKPKIVKDFHGNVIKSEDSIDYQNYQRELRKRERADAKIRKDNNI